MFSVCEVGEERIERPFVLWGNTNGRMGYNSMPSSGSLSGRSAAHLVNQRCVLGKLPRFMFAVYQLAINLHVEDSPTAGDHLALNPEILLDVCRQTDGYRFIVSLHAVFDRDVHVLVPPSEKLPVYARTVASESNQPDAPSIVYFNRRIAPDQGFAVFGVLGPL